jgi:hypothetical protein
VLKKYLQLEPKAGEAMIGEFFKLKGTSVLVVPITDVTIGVVADPQLDRVVSMLGVM